MYVVVVCIYIIRYTFSRTIHESRDGDEIKGNRFLFISTSLLYLYKSAGRIVIKRASNTEKG